MRALCVAITFCIVVITTTATNQRPIIGIVAQETSNPGAFSYIAASYVKFVEGGGARVVPIWIDKPRKYYKHIMARINGILFPGGDADFTSNTGYAQVGRYVLEIANDINADALHFPIWGTCLGFELLLYLANNGNDPRCVCSAQGLAQSMGIQTNQSRLLSHAGNEILNIMQTQNIAANFHHYCVTKENFTSNGLDNDWRIISTNKDGDGLEFISSAEHKKYPYYIVQFHPEKNLYEWRNSDAILHNRNATKVSQYFAEFFVDEARKNINTFRAESEANRYLIYNWPAIFVGRNSSSTLEQVYYFGKSDGSSHIRKLV